MAWKTRAHRTSTSAPSPTFDSERFLSEKNQEAFEKLNLKRNIWAERKVLLDELNPEIRRNFEHRGWLPLLDVDHPPPATLIREFYLNLFVHSYDSNTLERSWIQGDEYTIIPSVGLLLLGCQWSNILSTLMMSLLHWTTSCLISLEIGRASCRERV